MNPVIGYPLSGCLFFLAFVLTVTIFASLLI